MPQILRTLVDKSKIKPYFLRFHGLILMSGAHLVSLGFPEQAEFEGRWRYARSEATLNHSEKSFPTSLGPVERIALSLY